jgi:hypothetical protein
MHGATPMPFSAGLAAEIERRGLCVYTIESSVVCIYIIF